MCLSLTHRAGWERGHLASSVFVGEGRSYFKVGEFPKCREVVHILGDQTTRTVSLGHQSD